jgi:hypothetical protein
LETRLANRGRKPSDKTRAKYQTMKVLRQNNVKWVLIARRLGYRSSQSAQSHYRELSRKYEDKV